MEDLEDGSGENKFDSPYEPMGEGESPDTSRKTKMDTNSENFSREPLLLSQSYSGTKRKNRSMSKNLKSTWKHVRRGLSSEGHVVADAFIDSTHNRPRYVVSEHCNDLLVRARLKVLQRIDSLPIRLLGLVFLLFNIAIVVAEVTLILTSSNRLIGEIEIFFQVLDLLFSACFCVEVALRMVGLGSAYFKRCFEVFDLSIVVLSTLLSVVYVLLMSREGEVTTENYKVVFGTIRLIITGRIIRVLFWARVVYEHEGIQRFFRNKVSQNKRRYIDMDFDLDLTYVTDRVIAMSYPSSGSETLYRNSIRDVGQFLDKNHYGHYRVYNLCSEREYDASYFHNQVQRILIDDHNVPRFTDLVDFCEDVFTWMDAHPDNVIVVHCKGGKGRTGTMISAWLVRSGLFVGAGPSLAYFKDRRTDTSRGEKSQGVQTPSQSRYVLYYEKLLSKMSGLLPPPVSLRLVKMTLHGLHGVGKGDGLDWNFEIIQMQEVAFTFEKSQEAVKIEQNVRSDVMEIEFSRTNPVVLTDDVRFKFYCATRSIPTGYDRCHFYFWFHTTFIDDYRLTLDRHEVDNLQKSRLLRYYPPFFSIELDFEPA